jgi:Uri superfamily endonuclease
MSRSGRPARPESDLLDLAPRPQVLSGDAAALPTAPGCYALVLRLDGAARTLTVGRLGVTSFAPGHYVYCGSAQGPGGLRARVGRHVRGGASLHWHVDVLRAVGVVEAIWLWPNTRRAFECVVAEALAALPGAQRAVARFGSSDCQCAGHLIGWWSQ